MLVKGRGDETRAVCNAVKGLLERDEAMFVMLRLVVVMMREGDEGGRERKEKSAAVEVDGLVDVVREGSRRWMHSMEALTALLWRYRFMLGFC